MSNRLSVLKKFPYKIRNRLYGVNHFRFRILQGTNNLVNKGKTVCIIGNTPVCILSLFARFFSAIRCWAFNSCY